MRMVDIGNDLYVDLDKLNVFGFDINSYPSEPRFFLNLYDRSYLTISIEQFRNLKKEVEKTKEVKK